MTFAVHSSENYSIPNLVVSPGLTGSSENYLVFPIGEDSTASGAGSSETYVLTLGFPATIGVLRVPGNLAASADSNTQITVSWDSNGNPDGVSYQLQAVSPVSQSLYSGTDLNFAHSGLSSGSNYCYKIRAFAGVYAVYSGQVCTFTQVSDPVIGSDKTANAYLTDVNVQFTAQTDANKFYYIWDTTSNSAVSASDTEWEGTALIKTATSDGNWYFHVGATNSDDEFSSGGTIHYGPYNIDSNEPYTADDGNSVWQSTDVTVTLSPVDNASGVNATYYCTDSTNTCTPSTSGESVLVSCSADSTCLSYVRFYSTDLAGNTEATRSRLVRIDKQAPPAPTVTDEGAISSDYAITFTYSVLDNNGSGLSDFYLELRSGSTTGEVAFDGWTGDSDGIYYYLGALEANTYFARGKIKDALGNTSAFSVFTDGVFIHVQSYPSSSNYAVDMYAIVPSDDTNSQTFSIYDLVVGQAAIAMSSENYVAETGFAGGFMENSAPTISFNSPNSGYFASDAVLIDFNIADYENDEVTIDLYYSTERSAFQNAILDDVNLNDFASIGNLNCDNNSFGSTTNCIYTWYTANIQDNNYFFDFNTWDAAGASIVVSSLSSIAVDKTAPVTTSDYNGDWSGVDVNVTLSCVDSAGCSLTQYRLDSNPSKNISFGAWQNYLSPFEVSSDGNYAIDFNSKDSKGNTESTNREFVLINYALSSMELESPEGYEIEINEDLNKTLWYKCVDKAGNEEAAKFLYLCLDKSPPVTSADFNSAWQGSDVNIDLNAVDLGAGVDFSKYCVDDSNSCNPATGSTGSPIQVTCDVNDVCRKYARYYSVDEAGGTETTKSGYVRIDKNAPVTTSTFYAGWQGDVNVSFTCFDGNASGCQKLVYRIDSGSWENVSIASGDMNIEFSTDGNHLVEFYSVDNAGTAENLRVGWQAVDKTSPSTSITDPSTDNMEKGTPTIAFSIGKLSGSNIDLSSIVVEFNGVPSSDFNAFSACTDSNGDYSCSYTESIDEDDYNISIYVEDAAGNSRKTSRIFTLRAIVGVSTVTPSGGFVVGAQSISFQVKNTMLNNVYARIFHSAWFADFNTAITGEMNLDNYENIDSLSCEDAQFWDWTTCTYSWDSTSVADGNYFIDVNFWTASNTTTTGSSARPFMVDNTAPVASISGVSSTSVYSDRVYLGCSDAISGCKPIKWYYFTSSGNCSASKAYYSSIATADYINLISAHSDYICLWVEDIAGHSHYTVSNQLHVDPGVYVISSIPSESQTSVTQDLNNDCTVYIDEDLTVSCDFKSTLKISEWQKALVSVWQDTPSLVVSPKRSVRVLLQDDLESFSNESYFLKFESAERTIFSQGDETNYPVTVVRRRIIPLLLDNGELEVGTLTIKIKQR